MFAIQFLAWVFLLVSGASGFSIHGAIGGRLANCRELATERRS
jgi:hypothetical protein